MYSPAIVFRNMRYSKLEISLLCHFWVMLEALKSCRGDIMEALRVCGMPYLIPTPTLGSAFATRFTVAWSGNVKNTDATEGKSASMYFCSSTGGGGTELSCRVCVCIY